MAVDFKRIWSYYSQEPVQKALIEAGKNREVISVFQGGGFGKRPDVIQYPTDVIQAVAEGTVSFHGSVERWSNPMGLNVGMIKNQMDSLRIGWDLLIDPDVPDFEIGKIATQEIITALQQHGIKNYSCKFTGGKGFHIGVPFESLPTRVNLQPINVLYPSLSQKIIGYLKWHLRDLLKEKLLELSDAENLAQRVGKSVSDITTDNGLDPFKIISMDIFGLRHLFRLPYSLHESSLLVSMPINPDKLSRFEKEDASIEKVKIEEKFLTHSGTNDGESLVVEALDWASKYMVEEHRELPKMKRTIKVKEIPEKYFPPCISHILNGLTDGRKRALFILISFLKNVGWDEEKIQERVIAWNEKNYPPLRSNYIRSQLRWHFSQERNLLPPNCANDVFYKSLGIDLDCAKLHEMGIKNPVSYPLRTLKEGKSKVK